MSTAAERETERLPLSWLFVAWVGILVTQLVIGTIAAIGQADPYEIVAGWGLFPDFAMFAIVLYVLGTCIAVGILLGLLRSRGLGWATVGVTGSLTGKGAGLAAAAVVLGCVLYMAVDLATEAIGIPMYWYEGGRSAAYVRSIGSALLVIGFAVVVPGRTCWSALPSNTGVAPQVRTSLWQRTVHCPNRLDITPGHTSPMGHIQLRVR